MACSHRNTLWTALLCYLCVIRTMRFSGGGSFSFSFLLCVRFLPDWTSVVPRKMFYFFCLFSCFRPVHPLCKHSCCRPPMHGTMPWTLFPPSRQYTQYNLLNISFRDPLNHFRSANASLLSVSFLFVFCNSPIVAESHALCTCMRFCHEESQKKYPPRIVPKFGNGLIIFGSSCRGLEPQSATLRTPWSNCYRTAETIFCQDHGVYAV